MILGMYQMEFMFANDTSMLGHDKDIFSFQSHINDNLEIVSNDYKWITFL